MKDKGGQWNNVIIYGKEGIDKQKKKLGQEEQIDKVMTMTSSIESDREKQVIELEWQ